MTWNITEVIMLAIFCEAIVELWRKSAPTQWLVLGTLPTKENPKPKWKGLVRYTPALYSARQDTHMFQCGFCFATYVSLVSGFLYFYMDIVFVRWIVIAMVILRLSNHFHLIISTIRDIQIDRRIRRK